MNYIKEEQADVPFNIQLEQSGTAFPWGLLSQDERNEVCRKIRGIAAATSGGVMPGPWSQVSDERAQELCRSARGIMSVTAGGATGIFVQEAEAPTAAVIQPDAGTIGNSIS